MLNNMMGRPSALNVPLLAVLNCFFAAQTFAQTAGVTISPTELTVAEGGTGSYTLVLNSPPTTFVFIVFSNN